MEYLRKERHRPWSQRTHEPESGHLCGLIAGPSWAPCQYPSCKLPPNSLGDIVIFSVGFDGIKAEVGVPRRTAFFRMVSEPRPHRYSSWTQPSNGLHGGLPGRWKYRNLSFLSKALTVQQKLET